MSQGLAEGDEGTGEVQEAQIVAANPLPAHEQPTKAVVPSVGALHHPAAGLALDAAEQGLFATTADVGCDSAGPDGSLRVGVVVSLVEAEVLGTTRAARCTQHHRIESLGNEPLVVDVGAGDLGGQRDAAPVGQNVPLDAAFRAIRRVGAREIPPLGAFTMALSSEDHFHWIPRLRS